MNTNITSPVSYRTEYSLFRRPVNPPRWMAIQNLSEYIPSSEIKVSCEVDKKFISIAREKLEKLDKQIEQKIKNGEYNQIDAIFDQKVNIQKKLEEEKVKIIHDFETAKKVLPLKAQAQEAKEQNNPQAAKYYKQICDISQDADDWNIMLDFASKRFTSLVPTLCQRIFKNIFAPNWLKKNADERMQELSNKIHQRSSKKLNDDSGQLSLLSLRSQKQGDYQADSEKKTAHCVIKNRCKFLPKNR